MKSPRHSAPRSARHSARHCVSRIVLLAQLPLAAAVLVSFPTASVQAQTAAPALPAGPPAAAGTRRITLAEAVGMALERGTEIQIGAAGIEASEARVSAAGAQRLPVLRAEANILYWDKPLDIAFAVPAMGMGMPGMEAPAAPALRVRDQVTSQVTITLAQPISGLLVLHKLIGLERAGLGVAREEQARARLDTASRASEAYLRLLQARALEQIAAKSVTQVEAQLQRATVLEKAGALGMVDVLRLTSARDNARQALLRARTGNTVAQAALVLALDLPAGTPLDVVDDLPDPPTPLVLDERQASALALRERPELAAARQRIDQARGGRSVAKAALLPSILAVATYQNTQGQATFQPKQAWFVGATLSWDLWDWGKNWNGVKEADAKARQAEIGARSLSEQVAFDAQRRLLEARSAFETIAVARSALQAAEEAYRIQSVRYAEGAATTTDLIDAETDVSRARSGYTQSRYEFFLAQAAVARSVGRLPTAQLTTTSAEPAPGSAVPAGPRGSARAPSRGSNADNR